MQEPIQTIEGKRGLVAKIYYDENPGSPREWDNLGTIATWHPRRILGDVQPNESPDEYLASLPKGAIVLPVYMYEHSGIILQTYPFSCPWDGGQLGYIWASEEKILKDWGWKVMTKERREKIEKVLEDEIETYSQFLSGAVYGYAIERKTGCDYCCHEEEEVVDSRWGLFGREWVEKEARGQLDYLGKAGER